MRYKKIIFVSENNTYASPVAEAIMREKLKGIPVEVDSCGMVVLFSEPANPKGVAIAKSRGLNLDSHRAKPVDGHIFDSDVLILVMTEKIKTAMYEQYNNAVNVYTIKEFVGISGNVETPFGKTIKEYGESYTQIEELVSKVAEKLDLVN